MTANEEWRAVPGYEGFYEVSDQGRVRSLDRSIVRSTGRTHWVSGRMLSTTPRVGQSGYPAINLNRNGRAEKTPVHRLVMLAFVGPLPRGMQTRHLNGDHTDNRLANLAYGTPAENVADKYINGPYRTAKSSRTHCQRGLHEFTADNTVRLPSGHRTCRECRRKKDRENKRAQRMARKAVA